MSELSLKGLFKSAGNVLEGEKAKTEEPSVTCKKCGAAIKQALFAQEMNVCPKCGCHHRLGARERLKYIADDGTFTEFDGDIESLDPLAFPDYETKLAAAREKSGEKESVITGRAKIGGIDSCLFVMCDEFMMGSMGAATGEKLVRLFEYAAQNALPVIGCTASGGARMQEGMFSLVQMARVSAAVKLHSDKGLLYVAVLCDPTTGGVTASFAMLGDILIAEPGALIGFAGPRVIKQTMRQELPEGFQTAEYLLKCGFLDAVSPRKEHKELLTRLLKLHGYKGDMV